MKRTIKDFDLEGKKIIIRCDLNVPIENGVITDDTRIIASLRTIKYALRFNTKIILLSHLGKIKTEEDKKKNSLYPVAERLREYLNTEVLFSPDTCSDRLTDMVNNMKEKSVLLIENTRFEDVPDKRESECNDALAKYWASLGDIFINDAYGTCHRNHTSITGIPKYLPSGVGFLVEKEFQKIDSVLQKCDKLLIGGAMSFTFLKAEGYDVGKSIVSLEHLGFAKDMLDRYDDKIILPVDFMTADGEKKINEFNDNDIGYDIGSNSIKIFNKALETAKRVIFNGPMGLFEDNKYAKGTRMLFKCLDKNKVKTIIGGGDSAAAVNKLGFSDSFYHVSTGGGATMKYLESRSLVGIDVIEDKKVN